MAQPPPRKGAYNKFVMNLHKEQFNKLQAKNQQELDLLDDIRNFMKQKAAIEKHYAEGLLKLTNVYASKKIATIEDLPENARVNEHEHNIYQIWRIVLDENEKISKARLAAVQVFMEKISDDAKNVRFGKNMHAKRSLDRLGVVQRDVQVSVSEVDRSKRIYFSEESDALDVATKAQDADLKAKGKKRDVKSLFTSKSSLKKQAVKMSAKQDESDIKSTGARNDYILSLVTANAHQDRYFHNDLQATVREMEGGIYEKISEYLGTFARTELLTCGAMQNSFTKIKDGAETINREYNYRCYLKAFSCLGDHVQYAFEAVEGDTITTITPSEHDAGYSLNYEARSIAGKLNQAVKTIRAFRKRIKACQHHKAKGLKHEPNDPSGPNLDDKIEELENSIRTAETDKVKCEARLNKLREGGVAVDDYLDKASLEALEKESNEQMNTKDWNSSSNGTSQMETPVAEEPAAEAQEEENTVENGEWDGTSEDNVNWAETEEEPATEDQENWAANENWAETETEDWGKEGQKGQAEAPQNDGAKEIDPNAEVWKALVLFPFAGQNEDELTVAENEEIDVMVKECDEEGWLMGRNKEGVRGYIPYNYIEVYDFVMVDDSTLPVQHAKASSNAGQVVRQPSVESTASWGFPGAQAMPVILEQPPPDLGSSSEEESDEESPFGMGPPPAPPPQISILESEPLQVRKPGRPISIQFGSSMDSEYCKALYDYEANGSDELGFKEDEVIHIVSRSPNGVEDGWWMGELNGKTGLFPSIVVEECQANGDDWSPDVSLASPTSIGPPCFSPPHLDDGPDLPPLGPPGLPAPPGPPGRPTDLPSGPPPLPPSSSSLPGPPPRPTAAAPGVNNSSNVPEPAAASGLMLPETMITITNPTPLVENSDDNREETPVSYHVENPSFSMNMSDDKKEQYNTNQVAAPVEIEITCDDTPAADEDEEEEIQSKPEPVVSDCLTFTEIMVTAPTPRTQSPVEEEMSFPGTEKENVEINEENIAAAMGAEPSQQTEPVADNQDLGWASFQEPVVDEDEAKQDGADWANFSAPEPEVQSEPTQQAKQESTLEDRIEKEEEKKELPAHILDDLVDSEEEEEEKKAQVDAEFEVEVVKKKNHLVDTDSEEGKEMKKNGQVNTDDSEVEEVKKKKDIVDTDFEEEEVKKKKDIVDTDSEDEEDTNKKKDHVEAVTSSDSESEAEPGKGDPDSSDTESGNDLSSSHPSPRKSTDLNKTEDLEPKQLKKLETMKESPA